ncbi:MAG: hypothetical protein GX793_04740 [Bacteroidales bacterium]|nr:hypothetical protein [Bacteroidales bacterium]MCK9499535.1 hypothetical protein [Bacteroidales bacterium]MDY0315376.1 hypothetical protein [Bacteroidales bacterium]NLB86351.1 hypothetical protein [Bacteroidales bacterium]
MKSQEIIKRAIKILLNPITGWQENQVKEFSYRNLINPIFIITLIILFSSRLVGNTISKFATIDFIYILSFSFAMLIVDIIYFFLLITILNSLSPYYNISAGKNKISFFIYTCLLPFYFSIIIYNLFPALYFINIIIIYSFLVFYWGLKNYLQVKHKDALIIFISFSLIILGSYLVLNFLFVRPFFDFIF